MRVLVLTDWFVPGFRAGGPIRSVLNFTEQMENHFEIFVMTSDRDFGCSEPYDGIVVNSWIRFGDRSMVYYCSPEVLGWRHLLKEIRAINPDFIYLNSMFSISFSIYPILLRRLNLIGGKIILAPRGMLKSSALQFKRFKKQLFLVFLNIIRLPDLVNFHATDKNEWNDIQRVFGSKSKGVTVGNFPANVPPYTGSLPKSEGLASFLFVGRLHPIKNLDFLLQILPKVNGRISLTIAGTEENIGYVNVCKQLCVNLPDRISIKFVGEIPPADLASLQKQHHYFVLPTKGENFGHAIFEAFQLGRPVLISDQTPWRKLQDDASGWDLPLDNHSHWIAAIQEAVDADQNTYDQWSRKAWARAYNFVKKSDLKQAYLNLFS